MEESSCRVRLLRARLLLCAIGVMKLLCDAEPTRDERRLCVELPVTVRVTFSAGEASVDDDSSGEAIERGEIDDDVVDRREMSEAAEIPDPICPSSNCVDASSVLVPCLLLALA